MRKRDRIWTAIIATKQWFTKLFTSEADALVDAGKIQSGNIAIHQLDPSLSKP